MNESRGQTVTGIYASSYASQSKPVSDIDAGHPDNDEASTTATRLIDILYRDLQLPRSAFTVVAEFDDRFSEFIASANDNDPAEYVHNADDLDDWVAGSFHVAVQPIDKCCETQDSLAPAAWSGSGWIAQQCRGCGKYHTGSTFEIAVSPTESDWIHAADLADVVTQVQAEIDGEVEATTMRLRGELQEAIADVEAEAGNGDYEPRLDPDDVCEGVNIERGEAWAYANVAHAPGEGVFVSVDVDQASGRRT